ncbi:hypothetical protein [Acidimangrovimonas sediminis]|uniref:hypothetical protein n=1 Tax=Acidimangrovimonas sediminis TaxID=2056283 RepID=UPI000C7FD463|nr:hypothetical protein [Acidimangrovimonas sediminis]
MPRLTLTFTLAAALGLALASCTKFPKVDAAVGPEAAHAPYPHLAPLSDVTPAADAKPPENPAESLSSQGAALRAQAQKIYDSPAN